MDYAVQEDSTEKRDLSLFLAIVLVLCSPIIVGLPGALACYFHRGCDQWIFFAFSLYTLPFTIPAAMFVAGLASFRPDKNSRHVLLMWLAIAFTVLTLLGIILLDPSSWY
jgi:hypothetical protein